MSSLPRTARIEQLAASARLGLLLRQKIALGFLTAAILVTGVLVALQLGFGRGALFVMSLTAGCLLGPLWIATHQRQIREQALQPRLKALDERIADLETTAAMVAEARGSGPVPGDRVRVAAHDETAVEAVEQPIRRMHLGPKPHERSPLPRYSRDSDRGRGARGGDA
jgi:hypothetical protein